MDGFPLAALTEAVQGKRRISVPIGQFSGTSGALSADQSGFRVGRKANDFPVNSLRPNSGTRMNLRDLCKLPAGRAESSGAIRSLSESVTAQTPPNDIAQHSLRRLNEGSKVRFRSIRHNVAVVSFTFPRSVTTVVRGDCSLPGDRLDASGSEPRVSGHFAQCSLDAVRFDLAGGQL